MNDYYDNNKNINSNNIKNTNCLEKFLVFIFAIFFISIIIYCMLSFYTPICAPLRTNILLKEILKEKLYANRKSYNSSNMLNLLLKVVLNPNQIIIVKRCNENVFCNKTKCFPILKEIIKQTNVLINNQRPIGKDLENVITHMLDGTLEKHFFSVKIEEHVQCDCIK